MEDLLDRMCQLECERAQEVESSERKRKRLEEELAATGEQLCLARDDVLILRGGRKLNAKQLLNAKQQAKYTILCLYWMRVRRSCKRSKMCATQSRSSLLSSCVYTVQEAESLKVELEETQIQCSQVRLLSAALRESVSDLEGELRVLKCAQQICPAMSPVIFPGVCH